MAEAHSTISGLARGYRHRELSPVDVVRDALETIESKDVDLNAWITVTANHALADAQRAERALTGRQELGPLFGVPIGLKDSFKTSGIRTTAGSQILDHYVPASDATAVARLKSAGAIVIGKTNMHEFGLGDQRSGPTLNPANRNHTAAGSSSGSAAAVASGMVYAALGTDTCGSVTSPAARCGVVGLKPTYGRVSRHGSGQLAWSLDHVGILTRDVRDCATILQAISGTDDLDQSTRSAPELSELQLTAEPKRPLRVGVMPFDRSACDEAVKKAFDESIRRLQSLGVTVTTPAISSFSKAPAAVWPIMLAEAHSTYKHWLRSRPHELTVAMRLRLILGALITASDYLLAQRWRKRLVEDFARAFAEVDLLVAPSASTLAPHIDDVAELVGAWTEWAPYNLTGLPTITVPNGRSDENLPTGLLFVARWFDEKQLLEGAWHYSSS